MCLYKLLLPFFIFGHLVANGLSDLKATLVRYTAKSTIKGTFEVQTWNRQGKGKEAVDTKGQASALVEYGPQGLQMQWNRPFLNQLDRELRLSAKDVSSNNQISNALWMMDLRRAYSSLDASKELLRLLETAIFQSEAEEPLNGRPTRVLRFSVPQSGTQERFRRWIKEFHSTAKIWIDKEGNPLSYWQSIRIKARIFLVISFEQTQEQNITYSKIGDNLVCLRVEEKQEGGGGGEYASSRTIRSFTPQ
ncbi:MAG: hypothetical protein LBH03_04305 [Holophagales bacterium]|jgi:hypothetical protein|nr:hypothetical protein [Holophagales bacterium]